MRVPMEMQMQLHPLTYTLAVLLIWSHWGLWIWLDHFEEVQKHDRFLGRSLTLLCGPAAWLTAFWRLTHPKWHRRRQLPQMQGQFWGDN